MEDRELKKIKEQIEKFSKDNTDQSPVDQLKSGIVPKMDLRDYFAGQALQGLISGINHWQIKSEYETDVEKIVGSAYDFADAMLEERRKE